MPKTSRELAIVLFIASSFLAPPCRTEAGQADRGRAKYEPPDGKTMVLIGCDWSDNFKQYKHLTGNTPAGAVFWYEFNGDTDFFWHNAREVVGENGVLHVNFNLVSNTGGSLKPYLEGKKDAEIKKIGEAFKTWGHPLLVTIGTECDFPGNKGYTSQQFIAVYRKIRKMWEGLGVMNVAYVVHFIGNAGNPRWTSYYPGDDLVDWVAFSLYWFDKDLPHVREIARIAGEHHKPVMIAESGPLNGEARSWEDWHGPFLKHASSLGVKAICYNNWREPPVDRAFHNSAFDRLPRPVAEAWGRAMKSPAYLHASPALYATLGAQAQAVARPADEPAMDEAGGEMISVRRASLSLSREGDCLLSVDTRGEIPPIEDPQGKPATTAGLPNAKVTLEEDGTHRAVYSFGEVATTADFAALNGSPMPIDGLSIDKTAGTLLLTPILVGKGPVKKSSFSFPRYTKAPVTATIDFEKFDNYTVFLTLKFAEGLLQVRVSPRHPGWQQDGSRLGATFTPIVNKRAGKESVMLEGRLEPEKLAEYAFRIPADPSVLGQRCELNVHLQGHEPASIAKLDVRGRVTPSFGVSLDADKDGVKINAVIRGGASEKAGLKAGDVLVSIDGEKVTDVIGTVDRLSDLTAGKDIPFVVRRRGQEKTIVVRGE